MDSRLQQAPSSTTPPLYTDHPTCHQRLAVMESGDGLVSMASLSAGFSMYRIPSTCVPGTCPEGLLRHTHRCMGSRTENHTPPGVLATQGARASALLHSLIIFVFTFVSFSISFSRHCCLRRLTVEVIRFLRLPFA
ncbi:hypothetical protein MANI_017960 [Metarhizium anisopliae]|nr:hypothetical protein MANI_017960 [Metarhizium anisopliae]